MKQTKAPTLPAHAGEIPTPIGPAFNATAGLEAIRLRAPLRSLEEGEPSELFTLNFTRREIQGLQDLTHAAQIQEKRAGLELTLAEAIDAIPCLEGLRIGTECRADRSLYFTGFGEDFIEAAGAAGALSKACAFLLVGLVTNAPRVGFNADLCAHLARMCQKHRDAWAIVLAAFARQGGTFSA